MKCISLALVTFLISLGLSAQGVKTTNTLSEPNKGEASSSLSRYTVNPSNPVQKPNWESSFVDGIAAKVKVKVHEKDKDNTGELIVTCEELRRDLLPIIPQLKQAVPDDKERTEHIKALTNDILMGKVNRYLIEQSGRYKGMKVPASYCKNYFNNILAARFGGDRALYNQYLQQNNLTDEAFKKSIEQDIMVDYLRGEVQKNCQDVSPKQIEAYYLNNLKEFQKPEQVHLSQIFLTAERADQVANIYGELKQSESFATVAQKYSQDEKQKAGGDWGWVNPSNLRPEIAAKIQNLAPKNYTTEPLVINGSIFIFYVNDRQPPQNLSLKDATPVIETHLAATAAQEAEEKWIRELQKEASIQILIEC